MSEPNTTDLGALRERLDGIRERYHSGVWPNGGLGDVLDDAFKDVRWLLAAYGAQAARLAAVERMVREYHDAAFRHDEDSDEHRSDECLFGFQAISHRAEHLLGMQDRCPCAGAVGSGEARDG